MTSWTTERPDPGVAGRLSSLRGSTISDVMFTSGTTGPPKGVITTHSQNLRGLLRLVPVRRIQAR